VQSYQKVTSACENTAL